MPLSHPNTIRTFHSALAEFSLPHPNSAINREGRNGSLRADVAIITAMLAFFSTNALLSQTWNWRIFTSDNSLLGDDFVTAVGIDSSGRRWTGTMSAGLCMIDRYTWSRFDKSNSPLPSDTIISILVHPDGTRWFGTHGGGLVSYRDDRWEVFNTENSGLPSNDVSGNAFILGPDSSLWVGTWGGGISRFRNAIWTTYDTGNSPLPDQTVWTACVDKAGALWFGTLNGLARFRNGMWRVYTTFNSCIPLNDIAALVPDEDGSIWLGTWGAGIARFDGTSWTRFNMSNSPLPNNRVEALTFDSFGRLWIGSWGGGVAIFDGADWIVLDSSNCDLPSNNIRMILHDERQEKMWICCDRGLAVCDYRYLSSVIQEIDSGGDLNADASYLPGGPGIRITMPVRAHVSVAIFSLLGEHIATLADELLSEGEHLFAIPEAVPEGLYYCAMSFDGKPFAARSVLVAR